MTLPEVVFAAGILLTCLTALATLLAGAVNSSQMSKARDEASNIANAKIEAARAIPYDRVGVKYANGLSGDPAGDILTPETTGKYTVETICTWVRDASGRAAYKKLTIRVSWSQPSSGRVEVTTMVYGKSSVAGTGDMVIKLRYRETGQPVVNSSISEVDALGQARGVMTDSNGEAFFAHLPVGLATLSITAPAGYILDTTTMASPQVTSDALTTLIAYVQKPATTVVKVRDVGGAPLSGATVVVRRADGDTATTTANAEGDVALSELLYADYSVKVTADGYSSATQPLTLTAAAPGQTLLFTMSPRSYYDLRVRVRDANNTQMQDATVHLKPSGGGTDLASKVTVSNGEVFFTPLSPGTYQLVVEKSGYNVQVQSVNVSAYGTIATVLMGGTAKGNMHIVTLDKNGHTRAIRVIISGPGYFRDSLTSSTYGQLNVTDLPVGSYEVSCYTDPASVATVIISAGQTADVTVSQIR